MLAKDMGFFYTPRSFANWLHGWIWWPKPSIRELMFETKNLSLSHIVSSLDQAISLAEEGFTEIYIGGLPFSYTQKIGIERISNSLLAIPPHSAESEKLSKKFIEYFDFLESKSRDFEIVAVSIHHFDYSEEIKLEIIRRGLYPIHGAHPNEKNSLQRMRGIFELFENCTTNAMGSHFAYALFCGCRVSISGPLYEFSEDDFKTEDNRNEDIVQKQLEYLSMSYLKKNFDIFFVDPKNGVFNPILGEEYVGVNRQLSPEEIIRALKWGRFDQIHGYTIGATRRILRTIRRWDRS